MLIIGHRCIDIDENSSTHVLIQKRSIVEMMRTYRFSFRLKIQFWKKKKKRVASTHWNIFRFQCYNTTGGIFVTPPPPNKRPGRVHIPSIRTRRGGALKIQSGSGCCKGYGTVFPGHNKSNPTTVYPLWPKSAWRERGTGAPAALYSFGHDSTS